MDTIGHLVIKIFVTNSIYYIIIIKFFFERSIVDGKIISYATIYIIYNRSLMFSLLAVSTADIWKVSSSGKRDS